MPAMHANTTVDKYDEYTTSAGNTLKIIINTGQINDGTIKSVNSVAAHKSIQKVNAVNSFISRVKMSPTGINKIIIGMANVIITLITLDLFIVVDIFTTPFSINWGTAINIEFMYFIAVPSLSMMVSLESDGQQSLQIQLVVAHRSEQRW